MDWQGQRQSVNVEDRRQESLPTDCPNPSHFTSGLAFYGKRMSAIESIREMIPTITKAADDAVLCEELDLWKLQNNLPRNGR